MCDRRQQRQMSDEDLERRIQRMERDVVRGTALQQILKAEADAAKRRQTEPQRKGDL